MRNRFALRAARPAGVTIVVGWRGDLGWEVVGVGDCRDLLDRGLDQHLVAAGNRLAHKCRRRHAATVVGLDLGWDSNPRYWLYCSFFSVWLYAGQAKVSWSGCFIRSPV